jgi:hypothetical protein
MGVDVGVGVNVGVSVGVDVGVDVGVGVEVDGKGVSLGMTSAAVVTVVAGVVCAGPVHPQTRIDKSRINDKTCFGFIVPFLPSPPN